MQNYSLTQSSNITSIIGIIILVLNHFHINIASDELTAFIGGAVAVAGVVVNWVHRYQKGDLKFSGVRK